MRYIVRVLWGIILVLGVFIGRSQGHSIDYELSEGHAGILTAYTPIADPVQFASVKVYAPGNDSVEYANGRTDTEGRFAFVPNRPGTWKVVLHMDSSHGPHGFTAKFEVAEDLSVPVQGKAFTLLGRLVIGVGFILGATGWLAYWAERRRLKSLSDLPT